VKPLFEGVANRSNHKTGSNFPHLDLEGPGGSRSCSWTSVHWCGEKPQAPAAGVWQQGEIEARQETGAAARQEAETGVWQQGERTVANRRHGWISNKGEWEDQVTEMGVGVARVVGTFCLVCCQEDWMRIKADARRVTASRAVYHGQTGGRRLCERAAQYIQASKYNRCIISLALARCYVNRQLS
jgi:hypothetical protein